MASGLVSGGLNDSSSLFALAARGDVKAVRDLLDGNAEHVNTVDGSGFTALHWAALHNRYEVAEYLLSHGAQVDGSEEGAGEYSGAPEPRTGQDPVSTPLHWACQASHVRMAKLLVEHGADIHRADSKGYQAVHYAAQGTKSLLVHYLAGKGADLNARDHDGRTPLHWAAYQDRGENVMYCIRQGAELNAIDSAGYTPLHWAASRGNLMSTKLLVEEGRVNSTIRDSNRCTPLDLAHLNSREQVQQYLSKLKSGGYELIVPHLTNRPYMYALICALPFLVEILPFVLWFQTESWILRLLIIGAASMLWIVTSPHHMPKNGANTPFPFLHVMQQGMLMFFTWYFRIWDYTTDWFWTTVVIHTCNIGFYYFGIRAASIDPGYFRGPTISSENLDKYLAEGMREEMFCPSCLHWRPNRSKHCRTCDKCVARFDHHCPWVNNCVALHTHKYFILFLATAITAHILFVPLAWTALFTEGVPLPWEAPFECAWYLYENKPWLTTVLGSSSLHGMWETLLLGEQVFCAIKNLTINERINRTRYYWLQDGEGRPFNHYEMSPLENVREVMLGSQSIDYTKPHPLPNVRQRLGRLV